MVTLGIIRRCSRYSQQALLVTVCSWLNSLYDNDIDKTENTGRRIALEGHYKVSILFSTMNQLLYQSSCDVSNKYVCSICTGVYIYVYNQGTFVCLTDTDDLCVAGPVLHARMT